MLQQISPYFNPTYTRTGWIGQPPVLDRHEVVTIDGDVVTLLDAKYVSIVSRLGSDTLYLIVSRVGVLYLTNNFEPQLHATATNYYMQRAKT